MSNLCVFSVGGFRSNNQKREFGLILNKISVLIFFWWKKKFRCVLVCCWFDTIRNGSSCTSFG